MPSLVRFRDKMRNRCECGRNESSNVNEPTRTTTLRSHGRLVTSTAMSKIRRRIASSRATFWLRPDADDVPAVLYSYATSRRSAGAAMASSI